LGVGGGVGVGGGGGGGGMGDGACMPGGVMWSRGQCRRRQARGLAARWGQACSDQHMGHPAWRARGRAAGAGVPIRAVMSSAMLMAAHEG